MRRWRSRRFYAVASISTPRPYASIFDLVSAIRSSNRQVMATDEDRFRIRPGRVRDRSGVRSVRAVRPRPKTFLAEVHQAIRRAGGDPNRLGSAGKGSSRFNARGRGAATALILKGRNAWSRDASGVRTRVRRVTVKARIVKLNPQRGAARGRRFASAKAVDAHLRYLERDGVNRDGEKGQVYSAERDAEDGRAFLDRGRDDRHQFRFIVSAEEGVELTDLRETTRDLMKRMEADLGTRLDWIAVDHHNTGHPHIHVLVRGVMDDGRILNIAGDYIAHGIRERASEIVTLGAGAADRAGGQPPVRARGGRRTLHPPRPAADRRAGGKQRVRRPAARPRHAGDGPTEPGAADRPRPQAGEHGARDRGGGRPLVHLR